MFGARQRESLLPGVHEDIFAERPISLEVRSEIESLFNYDSQTDHSFTECVSGVAEEDLQSGTPSDFTSWDPCRQVRLIGQIEIAQSEQKAHDVIDERASKDPNEASSRMLFASGGSGLGNILRSRDLKRALAVFDHARTRLS